jgi:hypothetical protein
MTRNHPIIAALLLVLLCGCEENPPDTVISQFERPQDVALVCYHEHVSSAGELVREPLPLACCERIGDGAEGYCAGPVVDATVLAFVTQTTPGEVAVVDLDAQSIIDQDDRIPYNSFVPVGGQPSDIAATWDGQRVYTANFETEDLSAIDVVQSFGPTMSPSAAIEMGGPAARLVIARAPAIRDRFAFVTQPTLGRVAIVALDAADCPAPAEQPHGCLLGYLRLDAATGIPHAVADDSIEGITPWAIVASDVTPSLYVGGVAGEYIVEIDSEVLVQQALDASAPGGLGDDAIVRRIELEGFTSRALALEPVLERWIYAVENELGGVIVVDLVSGELLPVNEDNPLAEDAYSIDLPGRARALGLIRLAEEGDPEPLTFNGSFAVVSTTQAAIFVIDADDENADPKYPHTMRSGTDWYTDDAENYPQLAGEPILEGDGTQLSGESGMEYGYFDDSYDAGVGDAGVECGDEDVEFNPESSYGVRMRCDPRQSSNETWTLTWEGAIGLSGAGVIHPEWDGAAPPEGSLIVVDSTKDFCAGGLLAGDQGGTYDGIDSLEDWPSVSDAERPGYPGDLLLITSDPTPAEGADCSAFEGGDLVYRVAEVLDVHALRIEALAIPLPTAECFGQAFVYEIRASEHWVLRGSKTGHLHHGSTDLAGQCLPIDLDEDEEERLRSKRHRVFEEFEFYNHYFTFLLRSEGGVAVKAAVGELKFTFATAGGFEPLYSVLGNNVTDIEPTPDLDLVLVDQAGEGLLVFDMQDEFQLIGSPVN